MWVTQLVTAYGRARRPDGARMALLEAARAGLRTGTEHQLRAFIVALWRAGHIDEAQARCMECVMAHVFSKNRFGCGALRVRHGCGSGLHVTSEQIMGAFLHGKDMYAAATLAVLR